MAQRVPYETVSYQTRNHCQCDFCERCRQRNSATLFLSTHAKALRDAQRESNCCCNCHVAIASRDYSGSLNSQSKKGGFTTSGKAGATFDPSHPEPVNMTMRNIRNGRTGGSGGSAGGRNKSKGAHGGSGADNSSNEGSAQQALDDVKRLERLLVLEHKARVLAELEARKLDRDSKGDIGPIPSGTLAGLNYTGSYNDPSRAGIAGSVPYSAQWEDDGVGSTDYAGTADGRGASRRAQCPVTPPPCCEASHHLQHALQVMSSVGRDPCNMDNKRQLEAVLTSSQRYLPKSSAYSASQRRAGTNDTAAQEELTQSSYERSMKMKQEAKETLQRLPPIPRPYGAGVVWLKSKNHGASASAPSGETGEFHGTYNAAVGPLHTYADTKTSDGPYAA